MHMVAEKGIRDYSQKGIRVGKYKLGKTLGEGNFSKVKFATNVQSGQSFAIKILDRKRVTDLNITDQIIREIETLKLLKHPHIIRLHEVFASNCKTKIFMVLEYVTGGELFYKIKRGGRLKETEGRKIFQQLIDGVSYCHKQGVFHRDLKLENILLDSAGNIKICDFGFSASPQHFTSDGLLHTTCGTPNYVAPEILANKGYDGAAADIWSCGVILFAILSGYLPFLDRNLAALYQKIYKGKFEIPEWLSPGARALIRRILDPSPATRINMTGIKSDEWFKQDYVPANPDEDEEEEEDINVNAEAFSIKQVTSEGKESPDLRHAPVEVSGLLVCFRFISCCFGLGV